MGSAKKPKKKGSQRIAGGGFGKPVKATAPKASLEAVAAKFNNRLPPDPKCAPCPCGRQGESKNKLTYSECCQPFHLGERLPDSPTRVLESRFTAFAYRLPLPLIRTTHRSNRDWLDDSVAWARALDREGMFDGFEFVRLEAGPEEASSDREAFITFRAVLRPKEGGEELAFTERSRFVREDAQSGWLYASGEVRTDGDDGAVLNRG